MAHCVLLVDFHQWKRRCVPDHKRLSFVDPGLDQFVDIKFENPGFLTSVADNLIKRHSADASFLLFLRPLLRAVDVVVIIQSSDNTCIRGTKLCYRT